MIGDTLSNVLLCFFQLGRGWPFAPLAPFAVVMSQTLANSLDINLGDIFVVATYLQDLLVSIAASATNDEAEILKAYSYSQVRCPLM